VTPLASLQPDTEYPGGWETTLLVGIVLLFGAIGEYMLFRGYAFQLMLRHLGPFATILPVSVLFGLSHSSNAGSSPISLINTIGWGLILGVAFLRSGDLWLPIGLHYGWNLVLPLLGVPVSGFKMGITGYALHWSIGDLWSGGLYGPEGGLLTTFVLIPLALFLWKAPIDGQEAFLLRSGEEG
jgi:membrane protease YdiL (CAAX protease family)